MTTPAEKFLTQAEQEKVTSAVHQAEQKTSGEIVPMVVSESHHYPMTSAIGGVIISLPIALLLTSYTGSLLWLGPQNVYLFLAFFSLLLFPASMIVSRVNLIRRFFLINSQVEEEVEEAAITSFYGEGLYRTRDENGILIFISLLEHRVWVLGDRGINEKIDPDRWQQIVAELTLGIKQGRQCEAICEAVHQTGEILKDHFPIKDDDQDELHNIIIR